jgi:hypothetical protein
LSFGSETGRTRSGTKGFSNKEKKQKKKKQDFHTHRRAYSQEGGPPNPEEVRARTVLALDRLGHQILSTEPGGYDLEDWTRNLNSLLDDFQEKVGDEHITDEFRARRQEALSYLSPASVSADIDAEIAKVTQEEEAAKGVLEQAQKKAAGRLASLREERDACAKELKAQKENLAELREAKQSRQFFSRILRSGPSTEQAEKAVEDLESKLRGLEEEIERSRKVRSMASGAPGEGDAAHLDALAKLEAAQNKLAELLSARQNKLQLTREREIATQALSGIITSMKLGQATSDGGAQVP